MLVDIMFEVYCIPALLVLMAAILHDLIIWAPVSIMDTRAIFRLEVGLLAGNVSLPYQSPHIRCISFWLARNIDWSSCTLGTMAV